MRLVTPVLECLEVCTMQMLKELAPVAETYAFSNSVFGQGILSRKWLKSQVSTYTMHIQTNQLAHLEIR